MTKPKDKILKSECQNCWMTQHQIKFELGGGEAHFMLDICLNCLKLFLFSG